MGTAATVLLVGLLVTSAAAAVSYAIYKLIYVSKPLKTLDYGRNFFAWSRISFKFCTGSKIFDK